MMINKNTLDLQKKKSLKLRLVQQKTASFICFCPQNTSLLVLFDCSHVNHNNTEINLAEVHKSDTFLNRVKK